MRSHWSQVSGLRCTAALALLLVLIGLFVILTPATGQVIRSGPTTCQGVALTFDMCPVRDGSGFDAGLIGMLIEHHIPATFFLSGRWIAKHDEQVRALLAVPYFELGTHGQVHAHLPLLDTEQQRAEIKQTVTMLRTHYGYVTDLFRPPYGEFNDSSVELTRALGLRFILWNVVSGDPDPRLSAEEILGSMRSKVRNGAVIVFHGNGKGQQTRRVVEQLYEEVLSKNGLRPVTVSQLLNGCGDGIADGRQ
jgi:peptidoglycan/xylan/chitin deacetylase (PgdA/CDA1 family)